MRRAASANHSALRRDVGVALGLGADAGDAQPLVEVGQQVVAVGVDEVADAVAHLPDDSLCGMAQDDPVVIIGAGLAGAGAAWALTRRGLPVVLVEQFPLGHLQGSSHGSARIVRRGYGDGLYVVADRPGLRAVA